ncbi:MAG: hypothetical protein G01um101466_608 [Parcubacteria group bacterium Gr01-1014_66]|nr:MAG: hypothetical protein G01um101466_608 [Parcubacteria group bacterium Gr01-1014_66]
MKVLQRFASVFLVAGFLMILASSSGFFILTHVPAAQNFVARWKLKKIFGHHGHAVLWEKPIRYDQLPWHLGIEVKKWEHATRGWNIPAVGDYSRILGMHLKNNTFVHILDVKDVIPNGSILTIFLLEQPTTQVGERYVVDEGGRRVRIPPHRHYGMQYVYSGAIGVWGELAAFPLEHYFPFEELRQRRLWIPQMIRLIRFWGGGIAGGFTLLGMVGFYLRERDFLRHQFFLLMTKSRKSSARLGAYVRSILRYAPRPIEEAGERNAGTPNTQNETHNVREEVRRKQACLRMQIETMYRASEGETAIKLSAILSQFPSQKRVRLNKALELQNRALVILERMGPATTHSALPYEVETHAVKQKVERPI